MRARAFSQVRERTHGHIAVAQRRVVWVCEEGVDTREDVWDIDVGTPKHAPYTQSSVVRGLLQRKQAGSPPPNTTAIAGGRLINGPLH